MGKSGSDKRQLKSIFEESLKEISSEGTDEFRRSVSDMLKEKRTDGEKKNGDASKNDSRPADLGAPEAQD